MYALLLNQESRLEQQNVAMEVHKASANFSSRNNNSSDDDQYDVARDLIKDVKQGIYL